MVKSSRATSRRRRRPKRTSVRFKQKLGGKTGRRGRKKGAVALAMGVLLATNKVKVVFNKTLFGKCRELLIFLLLASAKSTFET